MEGKRLTALFFIVVGILVLCAGSAYLGFTYNQYELETSVRNLQDAQNGNPTDVIDYEKAYQQGYTAGLKGASSDHNLHDPTYQEMKEFLANDESDLKPYNSKEHICTDYTADVNNNAKKLGINCFSVYIIYPQTGHSIVAFDTTDKGMLFIEPQYDKEVTLDIGRSYSQSNGFVIQQDLDDTIVRYLIIQ